MRLSAGLVWAARVARIAGGAQRVPLGPTALIALTLAACGGGSSAPATDTTEPGPYRVQVTVSGLDGSGLVLQNNSGDDLSVTTNGTQTFNTRLDAGATYSVTVKTQPRMLTQTCTLSGGNGTVGRQTVSGVTLQCVSQSTPYLYVANSGANSVSAFRVDETTGALTLLATRNADGLSTPTALAIDPVGGYLFVGNAGDSSGTAAIASYVIASSGASAGTLTLAGTASSAPNPAGLATSGDSAHVYATGVYTGASGPEGQARAFTVQAGGSLSALSGGAAATTVGDAPQAVVVHPQGRFVYVANRDTNTLSVLTRVAATGALTVVSTSVTGTQPQSLAIDPAGRWLYVGNQGDNSPATTGRSISVYSIDASTGALTAVETKTLVHAPNDVVVHPRGTHLYAVYESSNLLAAFQINSSDGRLTEVSGSPWVGVNGPSSVRSDGTGKFLYVSNRAGNTISVFSISRTTGVPTLIGGPESSTGTAPAGLALLIR
jgi:6-phosphogluconolactonase (cycloisomerase 2 family)